MASSNNAFGFHAPLNNVDGSFNNEFGNLALSRNIDGIRNNAFGNAALLNNVSGDSDTAIGAVAGANITGNGNVCIGADVLGEAGVNDSTYVRNLNTTVQNGGGFDTVTVRLADGRLGHAVSSRRHKEDMKPMDNASEALFALQPVVFRYKKHVDPEQGLDYGLIAEDVAKVAPELATHNATGEIENVRYQAIYAMLLNEFLKEHRKVQEQHTAIAQLEKDFQRAAAQQAEEVRALRVLLTEQAAQIERVSAQLKLSRRNAEIVRTL